MDQNSFETKFHEWKAMPGVGDDTYFQHPVWKGHSYSCRIYQIGGKITPTPTTEFIYEKLKEFVR